MQATNIDAEVPDLTKFVRTQWEGGREEQWTAVACVTDLLLSSAAVTEAQVCLLGVTADCERVRTCFVVEGAGDAAQSQGRCVQIRGDED